MMSPTWSFIYDLSRPLDRSASFTPFACHQVHEALKQVAGVVGAGGSFRMILHREDREARMSHPLYGSVIEVDVCELDVFVRDAGNVHGKAVVLRGDLDLPGCQVFDGLVAAMVAKLELEGLAPKSEAQDLMSKADAEDRFGSDQLSDVGDEVRHPFRFTRAIAQENP